MNEPSDQSEPSHSIRLRGPWQRTVIRDERAKESATPTTVPMPGGWCDDLGRDFQGIVLYRRMFNRPTGLDAQTQIHIRIARVVGHTEVRLNEQPLGTVSWPEVSARFDVTGLLQQRNQFEVQIQSVPNCDPQVQGLVGEVRLEIG